MFSGTLSATFYLTSNLVFFANHHCRVIDEQTPPTEFIFDTSGDGHLVFWNSRATQADSYTLVGGACADPPMNQDDVKKVQTVLETLANQLSSRAISLWQELIGDEKFLQKAAELNFSPLDCLDEHSFRIEFEAESLELPEEGYGFLVCIPGLLTGGFEHTLYIRTVPVSIKAMEDLPLFLSIICD